jgi:pimeloyl-ACP methyl ester carboxylesterase
MIGWRVLLGMVVVAVLALTGVASTTVGLAQSPVILHHDFTVQLPGFLTQAQFSWPQSAPNTAMPLAIPLVLLIHAGNPSDMDATFFENDTVISKNFLQIADFFNQNGIAVLRYNKRFVSNATTIDQRRYQGLSLDDFASDARTVLAALRQQTALTTPLTTALTTALKSAKPLVLGWSEGAAVALRLATGEQADDQRLHGIILLSPPTVVGGTDYGTLRLAPKLRLPLLLLQGEADSITTASETRRLLALLPTTLAQSRFYPGLGHSLGDPQVSQFAPITLPVLRDLVAWIKAIK